MKEKHLAADSRGLIREAYRERVPVNFFGWIFGIGGEGTDS